MTAIVLLGSVYIIAFHGDAAAVTESVSRKRAASAPMMLILPGEVRQGPYPVNMSSLRLTYRRGWGIDITDRIVDYATDREIVVPEIDLPPGKRAVEIYIEDTRKNVSRMLFRSKLQNVIDRQRTQLTTLMASSRTFKLRDQGAARRKCKHSNQA